jgi:protein TonB
MKKKIITALVAVVIGHAGVLWAVSHMKPIELKPIEKKPLKVKFVKIKEPPKPPPKPKEEPKA